MNRSKSKSRSRSRTKTKKNSLPVCKPKLYCGKKLKKPSLEGYDRNGTKDECFKKGMGVGIQIELNKIKEKLLSKGIVLVTGTRKKEKCIDKNGNIRFQ